VPEGALCFDVGAHVGNRTASWRRLGARVVAIEPQPDFTRLLRRLFRGDAGVVVEAVAVDRSDGELTLHLSPATPTVTTGSPGFIDDAAAIGSFRDVRWSRTIPVPAVTLDTLIARHGRPDFVKIDIEGLEEAALAGLSAPVPLLSFEFLAGAVHRAAASLDRLDQLGRWRFQVSRGESLAFAFDDWLDRRSLDRWLEDVNGQDFSGDIYARLEG